jgi:hypothetical protein
MIICLANYAQFLVGALIHGFGSGKGVGLTVCPSTLFRMSVDLEEQGRQWGCEGPQIGELRGSESNGTSK